MFKVDDENKLIAITRGDTGSIVFSATDDEGNAFVPTLHDRLIFSVAKKVGQEPLFVIMNEMDDDVDAFWEIGIEPEHTEELPFGNYAYDVQIELRSSATGELEAVDTIIGKTDEVSPVFRVWGEVSKESE